MVSIVSIPLMLEVHEVMRLWLKKPPMESPFLCACVLGAMFLNKISSGEAIAISASGRLAAYEIGVGVSNVLSVVVSGCLFCCGAGLASVGWVMIGLATFNVLQRVYHAQCQAGISCSEWAVRVALPVLSSAGLAVCASMVPRVLMEPSPFRVLLTTLMCESVLLPLGWFVVIDAEERAYLKAKVTRLRAKFGYGERGMAR